MALFLFLIWGPIMLAAGFAITLRWTLLRAVPRLTTRDAILTAIAGGVPLLVMLVLRGAQMGWVPMLWQSLEARAATPLVLGIVGVVLLSVVSRPARPRSTARLAPRTARTFLRPRQPISLAALTALAVALAITAGTASEVDELGRYTRFSITLGTSGHSASSDIYGWYYSFPSLVLLAVLLVITALAWMSLPRPAWGEDVDLDTAVRRTRAGNIARVSCGAVLLHLAVVFGSLGGTASIAMSTSEGGLGTISLGTPFAAMGPALFVAQEIATVIGVVLWMLTALTAVPMTARRRVAARVS